MKKKVLLLKVLFNHNHRGRYAYENINTVLSDFNPKKYKNFF